MNKTLCNYNILDFCRSDTDPKVFACLVFMCGETGVGRFTVTQVAANTGLTDKQVRHSLEKLVAGGCLFLETKGRGGTIATLPWGKKNSGQEQAFKPDSPAAEGNFTEKSAQERAETIEASSCGFAPSEGEEREANSSLNHFRDCNSLVESSGRSKTLSSNHPIVPPSSSPSNTEPEKPAKYFLSRREAVAEVCGITKNTAVREAAAEWIAMRYAKRGEHKLTAKAIHGAFQKLRNMGYNSEKQAVACFEQSIEHLWDGLFEIKG